MQHDAYSGWGRPKEAPAPVHHQKPAPPPDEAKRLIDDNNRLRARVAELEAHLSVPPSQHPVLETGGVEGIPPPPDAIVQATGITDIMQAAEVDEGQSISDIQAMEAKAAELGIKVDRRWGYKRLAREIAQAEEKAKVQ